MAKSAVKPAAKPAKAFSYFCTNCSYKFSRTHSVAVCPYCGKPNLEIVKENAAERLLGESHGYD